MAMKVLFCNGSQEKVAFNEMLCSLMEKAAIETAVVFGKLAVYLLAMGTLSNGLNMMGNEVDIKQGDEDSFPVEVKQKVRKGETQLPSQKDDGETDDDDDDDEDEDADDQDDYGGEDDLSGEEGNDNEGDEDPADEVEANGEGGSDDGDEDGEDDDEDDDDDDDDDGDEEDDDDEDEEEIPEPPSKKRK